MPVDLNLTYDDVVAAIDTRAARIAADVALDRPSPTGADSADSPGNMTGLYDGSSWIDYWTWGEDLDGTRWRA